MKYSQGQLNRVFVIRLEDGDKLPAVIESFAREQAISCGFCLIVGGIRDGGRIVAGPEDPAMRPIDPILFQFAGVHEILGAGMIFPDEDHHPRLHMHAALGRAGETRTGCIRPGIEVWQIGEVILLEIKDCAAMRKIDPATGFELLEI